MELELPSIYLLPLHMEPEELHRLEEMIPSLTYDIQEAELVLGRLSKPGRAKFELRRAKLETTAFPPLSRSGSSDGRDQQKNSKLETSDAVRPESVVRVLRLDWLEDSLAHGEMLPVDQYLVYEGFKVETTRGSCTKSPLHASSDYTGGSEKSGSAQRHSQPTISGPAAPPSKGRPTLIHESTSEHETTLPPVPEFLYSTYSCQRPTLFDPPNREFVEQLKRVRTLRLLEGDHIGVRAYSSSIATISAYPYSLKSPAGQATEISIEICCHALTLGADVARLPGCGTKIAVLYEQWRKINTLQELLDAESNTRLTVLKAFHDIWGVGDVTARDFYRKGWRDMNDLTEFAWDTLTRVQQIGVKFYDDLLQKIPRHEVEAVAATILKAAREVDEGYEMIIVGGYRRGKAHSGDVDVILSHACVDQTLDFIKQIVARLESSGHIRYVLSLTTKNSARGQRPVPWRGDGTGSGFDTLDKALIVWQDPNNASIPVRRVDIIVSPWRTVGCAVLGWSGGTTFQRDLRRYCKKEKGLKFDSSGIRSRIDGAWVDFEEGDSGHVAANMEAAERRVFAGLDLEYRRPEERCTG